MRPLLLLLAMLLAGCIPKSDRPSRPRPAVSAPAPEDPAALRQCLADLDGAGVRYQSLPDKYLGGGCSAVGTVKLVAIGTPVTNLGAVKCPLALALARWTREVVQPAALETFGGQVTRIESFGTFACRPVNGVAGNKLSQHGLANAVDVAAFQLAGGRRFTVKDGWRGDDEQVRGFLRTLHRGACRRFNVVLGPDANAYHHDHFHFDMGRGPYCR